jgi:hypothetical protein
MAATAAQRELCVASLGDSLADVDTPALVLDLDGEWHAWGCTCLSMQLLVLARA